ncbi:hypothetical protein SISNIDRAFT_489047 [Sistotremastrum niveocremeum HHB9708]|uniref:Uncharacterized protein n=1 Tax=Sistotremastrum niveocremeum HHB9708 TaxID=1314777 RepID=A0A164QFW2_9AGAM|nr:hypothetical protein SISNIDRAFT_489047 [Sistotremastrum niveocremeum HHB9708]
MDGRCSLLNLPPSYWNDIIHCRHKLAEFGNENSLAADFCRVPFRISIIGSLVNINLPLCNILGLSGDLDLKTGQPLFITISSSTHHIPKASVSVAPYTTVDGGLRSGSGSTSQFIGATEDLNAINDLIARANVALSKMNDVEMQMNTPSLGQTAFGDGDPRGNGNGEGTSTASSSWSFHLINLEIQVLQAPSLEIRVFPGCSQEWWKDVEGRKCCFSEQGQSCWLVALDHRAELEGDNKDRIAQAQMFDGSRDLTVYVALDNTHGNRPLNRLLPGARAALAFLPKTSAPVTTLKDSTSLYSKQMFKLVPFFDELFKCYKKQISAQYLNSFPGEFWLTSPSALREVACRRELRKRVGFTKLLSKRRENTLLPQEISSGLDSASEEDFEQRCHYVVEEFGAVDGLDVVFAEVQTSRIQFVPFSHEASSYLMGTESDIGEKLNTLYGQAGQFVLHADELRRMHGSFKEAVEVPVAQIKLVVHEHLDHLKMALKNALGNHFKGFFGPSMEYVIDKYIYDPVLASSYCRTADILNEQLANLWLRVSHHASAPPDELIAQFRETATYCETTILQNIRAGHESDMQIESDLNSLPSPPTSPVIPSEVTLQHSVNQLGALALGDPANNILWRLRRADYGCEILIGARIQVGYPVALQEFFHSYQPIILEHFLGAVQQGVRTGLKEWRLDLTDEDRQRIHEEYDRYNRESQQPAQSS